MSENHSDPPTSPLPSGLSWFAPWRYWADANPWKRRLLIAFLLMVGYLELPILVVVAERQGILGKSSWPVVDTVLFPLDDSRYPDQAIRFRRLYNLQLKWWSRPRPGPGGVIYPDWTARCDLRVHRDHLRKSGEQYQPAANSIDNQLK